MSGKKLIGKRDFISLFSFFISILLLSACSNNNREWEITSNDGIYDHYKSSRIRLAAEDDFTGLEVDFIHTKEGTHTYLNALGITLVGDDNREIPVNITTDGNKHTYTGYLLKGGHRIKLPQEAEFLLIDALHQGQSVDINVAHYSTHVEPGDFAKHYKKVSEG